MRILTLNSTQDFNLLYQGFTVGGNSQQSKTMQVVRREAKILDKLEAISQPVLPASVYPSGEPVRELRDAAATLRLTAEEHELLKKYFDAVPWTTQASRFVVKMADRIEAALEEA
jgi:hypothetical protein